MGRVRRYKKVKAVDPFSNRSKKSNGDAERQYNLPPNVKNHKAARLMQDGSNKPKTQRKRLAMWMREEIKQTKKDDPLSSGHSLPSSVAPPSKKAVEVPKIEPKQPGESLRSFNKRLREDTARILRDDYRDHSSTVAKKKRYLKERSEKKKLKKQGLPVPPPQSRKRPRGDEVEEEEDEEEAGYVPGGDESMGFRAAEDIRFGEVVDAPPRFTSVPKRRDAGAGVKQKAWVRGLPAGDRDNSPGAGPPNRKGGGGPQEKARDTPEVQALKLRQMQDVQERVRAAYANMKEQRRSGRTQFVAENL